LIHFNADAILIVKGIGTQVRDGAKVTMIENDIPAAARDLATRGQIIEAVKVTRVQTGLSLIDAKNAVEAYLRHPDGKSRFSTLRERLTSHEIPPLAIAALEEGRFLDAIKHTRAARALGLKAAKECVEDFLEQHADINARFRAASSTEFRRIIGKLATIVALLGIMAVAYFYFSAR
jgi:ribosomal protein L7/L12